MPGKFIKLTVGRAIQEVYGRTFRDKITYRKNPNTDWNKDDTYISIFGANQQNQLKALKEHKEFNILFESKKAYNLNMGAYLGPRNTVVVYELK